MSDPTDSLATAAPGAELAALLAGVDLTRLSAHDLVLVAQARQRQLAHDEAALLRVFAELAARPEYQHCAAPSDLGSRHAHRAVQAAGDELSLALRWTPTRATTRVALAVELIEDLPDTFTALETGRIDADKARLIADRTRCLTDPDLRRRVEAAVLPDAHTRTRWALDQRLRRDVIAADPAAAEDRRRRAAERRLVGRPEPASPGGEDAMATLTLYGPAEDVTALWVATDAAARHARTTGDHRTLDQLRFDLLTGLAWTALETGHLGCCRPDCATHPDQPAIARPAHADQPAMLSPARPAQPAVVRPAHPDQPATLSPAHPGQPDIAGLAHADQPAVGALLHATGPGDIASTGASSEDARSPAQPTTARHHGSGAHRATAGDTRSPTHPTTARHPGNAAHTGAAEPVLLGRRRGKAATVHVTVPIDTLAGGDAPGDLDGYGPITATAARRIAAEATWRRLLTDPADGRLLDYGRTTYTPPADLAAHVITRDRTCRFPTCHRPATDADIDHRIPYANGGTTSPDNTWALHDGHHKAKTWHRFIVTTDRDGTTWWTTPAGHHYPVEPDAIGPVLSAPAPALVGARGANRRHPEPAPF